MAGWPIPISPSQAHFNREEATTARQSAELASQRAYQIRAQDMAAAGLNPILAASQGGAPVPAQASASIGSGGTFDPTASSAMAVQRAQEKNVNQDTQTKRFETDKAQSDSQVAAFEASFVHNNQGALSDLMGDEASARSAAARIERKLDEGPEGATSRLLQRYMGGNPLSSAVGAARLLTPSPFSHGRGLRPGR